MENDANNEIIQSFNINAADANGLPTLLILDSDPGHSVPPQYTEVWELLKEWNLDQLFPVFYESEVTLERLKYLSVDDIKELIPKIGLRADFRERLVVWKKEKFNVDDRTVSCDSKVTNWIKDIDFPQGSPSNISLADCLLAILKETAKGQALISFYDRNGSLLDNHRQDLINIIIERVLQSGKNLHPFDFEEIAIKINKLFPTENKDYYYIGRKVRKNPGGKLYDKFHNLKCKRKKIEDNQNTSRPILEQFQTIPEHLEEKFEKDRDQEFDEDVLGKLKEKLKQNVELSLSGHGGDDLWNKTYLLRRQDLRTIQNNSEFLDHWPSLKEVFGYKLINRDFSILYPEKESCLFNKWDDFKKNIFAYYSKHLKNQKSREEFASCKQLVDKDSSDYIAANLLNSVITPTARFTSSTTGKNKRKFTIADAEESFVLHLISINNYKTKVDNLKSKYLSSSLTIQPIIIVVGDDIYQIKEFFIYLDNILFKLSSFIECLSTCFKIFQVLNLSYPKACQGVWLFIQKYFFEIETRYDAQCQSPSVVALLNYFENIKNNISTVNTLT